MKIGAFDSGKGGVAILDAIKKLLPNEEYSYIADSKNCPYGEKSDSELYEIVTNNIKKLQDWGAVIVVIACNTATTKCIDRLREDFPELYFIGTEPAVKLAVDSGAKNILVLATPGTIKSEHLQNILHENQNPNQKIKLLACPGLADAIEFDRDIDTVLQNLFADINTDEPEAVVIGCTHYSLIKDKLQSYFPHAKLIDGNNMIANQVKNLTEKLHV